MLSELIRTEIERIQYCVTSSKRMRDDPADETYIDSDKIRKLEIKPSLQMHRGNKPLNNINVCVCARAHTD